MNWLMFLALCLSQGEGHRTIPPMACELKTGPELAVFEEHLFDLEQQLDKLEKKIAGANEGGTKISSLLERQTRLMEEYRQLTERSDPEVSRLHHEVFVPALKEFQEEFSPGQNWTVDRIDGLFDQLYVDLGHPSLNYRYARSGPIDRINALAREPSVDPEIRQRVLSGLMAYTEVGLGQDAFPSPDLKSDLAEVLIRVGQDNSLARGLAQQLVANAVNQSLNLGRLEEVQSVRDRFRLVPDMISASGTPTTDCNYEGAAELLYQFLRTPPEPDQQEKFLQYFLRFLEKKLDEGKVSKTSLPIAESCLKRIWNFLIDRSKEKDSFELWSAAAKALGAKTSEDFREFVRNQRKEAREKSGTALLLDRVIKSWD